ncbi:unnamed protein product [Malus baccata var. baccata]
MGKGNILCLSLKSKLGSCGGRLEEMCEFQSKRVNIRLLAVAEERDECGDGGTGERKNYRHRTGRGNR